MKLQQTHTHPTHTHTRRFICGVLWHLNDLAMPAMSWPHRRSYFHYKLMRRAVGTHTHSHTHIHTHTHTRTHTAITCSAKFVQHLQVKVARKENGKYFAEQLKSVQQTFLAVHFLLETCAIFPIFVYVFRVHPFPLASSSSFTQFPARIFSKYSLGSQTAEFN